MFFADAGGGVIHPAPPHLTAPDRPTISRRVVIAIAALVVAAMAALAIWSTVQQGAQNEPVPVPPAGPFVAGTAESSGPDVLGGHTPASQLLLEPETERTP